jgi:hypothetical protein
MMYASHVVLREITRSDNINNNGPLAFGSRNHPRLVRLEPDAFQNTIQHNGRIPNGSSSNSSGTYNKALSFYLPGEEAPTVQPLWTETPTVAPVPQPSSSATILVAAANNSTESSSSNSTTTTGTTAATPILQYNESSIIMPNIVHHDNIIQNTNVTPSHSVDVPPPPTYVWPKATGNNCDSYKAVLHIESGDQGAAAGTLFFQYMINQLIYAEMYNLIPWIHLNNITQWVYDEEIHGVDSVDFELNEGWIVPWQGGLFNDSGAWPGEPRIKERKMAIRSQDGIVEFEGGLQPHSWSFRGRGVWNDYFEPVSAFNPQDPSCQKLALVHLDYEQLNPGIQFYAPFAVRSWEYGFLPAYLRYNYTDTGTLHNWFGTMRERAHTVVNQYFKFKPNLIDASFQALPNGTQCLGLHVRHTDKAGLARRKVSLQEFLPYVMEYARNGGDKVYLATDSGNVVLQLRDQWAEHEGRLIVQNGIVRSNIFKPVFRIGKHNQTNTEVLIDIFALSRCQFLIHGFSAVSESAIYLNLKLHNQSVDLEDPSHPTPEEFGHMVRRVLNDTLSSQTS